MPTKEREAPRSKSHEQCLDGCGGDRGCTETRKKLGKCRSGFISAGQLSSRLLETRAETASGDMDRSLGTPQRHWRLGIRVRLAGGSGYAYGGKAQRRRSLAEVDQQLDQPEMSGLLRLCCLWRVGMFDQGGISVQAQAHHA